MINRAFICYRRSDAGATARWLRAKLSTFSPHDAWVATLPDSAKADIALGGDYYIDRIGEIPDPGFWENVILPALRESKYLIVLSSPAALEPAADGKNWVVKEIEAFLKIHGESAPNRIIVALAPGAPIDRLPGPLNEGAADRAWVDLRQVKLASWMGPGTVIWRMLRLGEVESRYDAMVRLSVSLSAGAAESSERALRQIWARLFSIDPGRRASLYQIDARQRAWTRRLGMAGLALFVMALAAALGTATWSWLRSLEERDAALRNQSRLLAREADNFIRNGDYGTALALALEALPRDTTKPSRPYVVEAEAALQAVVRHDFRERYDLPRHSAGVVAASFSPNGRYLLTADWNGTTRVWVVQTGQLLNELSTKSGRLESAMFSPDNERILITGDKAALIWQFEKNVDPILLNGHTGRVNGGAFSHDGRRVVTTSDDGITRLWDARSGRADGPDRSHKGGGKWAIFSPDDKLILTVANTIAYLWDVDASKAPREFRHPKYVTDVAFSLDSRHLLTASGDNLMRRWDLSTESQSPALIFGGGRNETFSGFALSPIPKSTLVLAKSHGATAGLWDYATGYRLHRLVGHEGSVDIAAFSRDGNLALTMSRDRSARLWDVASGKQVAVLRTDVPTQPFAEAAAFSPDGTKIVTAWTNGGAQVWEITPALKLSALRDHPGRVESLSFTSDGKLLTASSDGKARLWTVGAAWTGSIVASHGAKVNSVVPFDSTRILTASADYTAQISSVAGTTGQEPRLEHLGPVEKAVATARRIATLYDGTIVCRWPPKPPFKSECLKTHDLQVNDLALSPDSRYFLTGSIDNTARLWDAATGAYTRHAYRHEGEVTSVAFSRDGKMVLTGSRDRTAKLWHTQSPLVHRIFGGHGGGLYAAIFSPDNARILTTANDGLGRLWDVTTGVTLASLHAPEGLQRVSFSNDGRQIASASGATIQIWRNFPTTQELIDYACSVMPRPLSREQRKKFFVDLEPQDPPCGWQPDMKDKPAYTPLDKSKR